MSLLPLLFAFLTPSHADIGSVAQDLARSEQHSIRNLEQWNRTSSKEAQACVQDFAAMFADGVLNVSISLGYNDSPATKQVEDQETYQMLIQSLTRSCASDLDTVCGFSAVESPYASLTVLEKEIYPYEELKTSSAKVRVEITYASWSTIDADNFFQGEIRPEQIEKSKQAEAHFLDSLTGKTGDGNGVGARLACDVCIYMGHARNGGGPDFYPVPLKWANSQRKPNYAYYLKERNGFRKLVGALNRRDHSRPGVLALLGCNSLSKFYPTSKRACGVEVQKGSIGEPARDCKARSLKDFSGQMGFVLTDDLSWPSNRSLYFGATLEAALSLKCRSSWESNFKKISGMGPKPESYGIFGRFLSF